MKHLLLTLITVCFLLAGGFNTFSQSTKRKLVKCTEKGKIVYRTKCKTKKPQPVANIVKPTEKYGDPNSKFEISDSGTGTGQGRGTGSGSGSGMGNGSGSGTGSGSDSRETPAPPKPVKSSESTALKIISKPKAEYTEIARTNKVEGTVIVRVTFLANGTIGEVTPVRGLADGLTQQAINAAKFIRFEPATKDGKPITVTRQVEYNFTLY